MANQLPVSRPQLCSPLPLYLSLVGFAAGLFQVISAGVIAVHLGGFVINLLGLDGMQVRLRVPGSLLLPNPDGRYGSVSDVVAGPMVALAVPEAASLAALQATLHGVVIAGVLLELSRRVRRGVHSVRTVHPFAAENTGRLRQVGWLCLGAWAWSLFHTLLAAYLAGTSLSFAFVSSRWLLWGETFLSPWLGVGLVVLAAAEIFRIGVTIKQENDLTV